MFADHLDKYYMPPEANSVNPVIPFSPMPGGALTANTQMMRDNNSLDLFPKVIENMREVVAKGGCGTSVTPVSQFYFQQAFANTVQEKWSTITADYGKMLLGYFGKTPAEPDQEIKRIASSQLNLEPTSEDVHDINDRNSKLGVDYNKKLLEEEGLETTEENIFISATCGSQGIAFLKGEGKTGIRYKEDVKPTSDDATSAPSGSYKLRVNGEFFDITVYSK